MEELLKKEDYDSLIKLGNLYSRYYRFKEASATYKKAAALKDDDFMTYLRLGGALLTLRDFNGAKKAYDRVDELKGNDRSTAFVRGVWHYLQSDYTNAKEKFLSVLPCDSELEISVLYWVSLCELKSGQDVSVEELYIEEKNAGHHSAYKIAVKMILGKVSVDDAIETIKSEKSELNKVIGYYGIASYLETKGEKKKAEKLLEKLFACDTVWACIPYLSAFHERNSEIQ